MLPGSSNNSSVGGLGGLTAKVLGDVVRVEDGFLRAHSEMKSYRPIGVVKRRKTRSWSWRVPEAAGEMRAGVSLGGRNAVDMSMSCVSFWPATEMAILLVSRALPVERPMRPAPKLRHQDAATRRSALQLQQTGGSGQYGAMGTHPGIAQTDEKAKKSTKTVSSGTTTKILEGEPLKTFEDDLREALDGVDDSDDGGGGKAVLAAAATVEGVVEELVYQRWIDYLAEMRFGAEYGEKMFWQTMAALEQNLDEARYLTRQGKTLDHVAPSMWEDLIQRLHLRIELCSSSRTRRIYSAAAAAAAAVTVSPNPYESTSSFPQPPRHGDSSNASNQRSLDRIAYLGGILLPITVVAGIFSIEGTYGPGGSGFWLFWVVSAASSLVALLVIYLDQARSVEVWMEVVGDALSLMDGDGGVYDDRGEWSEQCEEDEVDDDGCDKYSECEDDRIGRVGRRDGSDRLRRWGQRGGYFVQRRRDGTAARAWKKGELGWGGAVKKASGYYAWRGNPGIVFGIPQVIDASASMV